MTPTHHPGDDHLISYAAGALEEPVALVVATHLALCPRCRKDVERLEAVGGALLEEQEAVAVEKTALERTLARLDEAPLEPERPRHREPATVDAHLPSPLRDYLGGGLDRLDWKSHKNFDEAELLSEIPGFRTRLMRIKSGTAMPAHTHQGSELTLVLAGGFSDELGHFLRGDVAEADASVRHQPVADPGEDCLCLAVTDAPLRLTGPVGRLLNPFIRI